MEKSFKRTFVFGLALALCVFAVFASQAPAADYPKKPIHLIYPFPAGSGGDIATRILADGLTKILKVPVKVSNVTGGRATIGAAKVAKAKPDGYEIGSLPIGPAVTQPVLAGNLPYKTEDLVPIGMFTYLPIVLVANADTPYKTTKELIGYAKKNPNKVKYAHPGVGSVPYMMMKALEASSGVEMKGVPFKGLRPGITAAVGGHVDVALAVASGAMGFQKAGKLNILGLFASNRMELLPDVPTMDEDGIKDYAMLWTGLFAPKGTDDAVLKKLGDALAKAVTEASFIKAMTKAKLPVAYMDQKQFAQKIAEDIKTFEAYKAAK